MRKNVQIVIAFLAWVSCWLNEKKTAFIETLERAIKALQIKRTLARQEGKGGMEALFGMALIGIVLIIFIMKLAPTMFTAAAEVPTGTEAGAPDATSAVFLQMLPWVFIAILVVVIIMVMVGKIKGGKGG